VTIRDKNGVYSKMKYVNELVVILLCSLASCGSPGGSTLREHEVDEDVMKRAGWTLPQNYDTEMAHRDIVLICSFHTKSPRSGQVRLGNSLSTQMQTELGRINRFKVYCLFGDGTYRLAEDLISLGELAPIAGSPARPDLFLTGEVVTNVGKVTTRGGNEKYTYQVTAALQMMDKNKIQLWGRNITGGKVSRTAVLGSGGRVLGGFDPRSEDDVMKALEESARPILWRLGQTLGKEYPVTGAIKGKHGNRLSFTKGTSEGLSDATQMWVWYRMKGGLAIPIGKARALPSRDTATLEVYQWNTRDEDAKSIINQLDARPDWMQDKAGDREGIFATTAGLPIPPGWDPARIQYEDAKKNR
jgi:hypothetical protein